MDVPSFCIYDITKVAESIETVYSRIEHRKKLQNIARKAIFKNRISTLQQISHFDAAFQKGKTALLRKSFRKWQKHQKWRELSRKIVKKCKSIVFAKVKELYDEQKKKANRRNWVAFTKFVIEEKRDNDIADLMQEKHAQRLGKECIQQWNAFKSTAKDQRREKFANLAKKLQQKELADNLQKGLKTIENAKRWKEVSNNLRKNEIKKNIEKANKLAQIHDSLLQLAKDAQMQHLKDEMENYKHHEEIRKKWEQAIVAAKAKEFQKVLDRHNEITDNWKKLASAALRENERKELEKEKTKFEHQNKWKNMAKGYMKKARTYVLHAGRKYIDQSRSKLRSRKLSRVVVREWNALTQARDYVRVAYNSAIDAYSISFQNAAAEMIQSVFRTHMRRQQRNKDLFILQHAFLTWVAARVIRKKAKTTFPKLTQAVKVETPKIDIKLPKLNQIFKPSPSLIDRLSPLREMFDLKHAIEQANITEQIVEEEEEEIKEFEKVEQQIKQKLEEEEEERIKFEEEPKKVEEEEEYVFESPVQQISDEESEDITKSIIKDVNDILDRQKMMQTPQVDDFSSDFTSEPIDVDDAFSTDDDEKLPEKEAFIEHKPLTRIEKPFFEEPPEPIKETKFDDKDAQDTVDFIETDEIPPKLVNVNVKSLENLEIVKIPEMTNAEAEEAVSFLNLDGVLDMFVHREVPLNDFQLTSLPMRDLTDLEAMQAVPKFDFDDVNHEIAKFDVNALDSLEIIEKEEEKFVDVTDDEVKKILPSIDFNDVDRAVLKQEPNRLEDFTLKSKPQEKKLEITDDLVDDILAGVVSFDNIFKPVVTSKLDNIKPKEEVKAEIPEDVYEEIIGKSINLDDVINSIITNPPISIENYQLVKIPEIIEEEEVHEKKKEVPESAPFEIISSILNPDDVYDFLKPHFASSFNYFMREEIPVKVEEEEEILVKSEEEEAPVKVEEEESQEEIPVKHEEKEIPTKVEEEEEILIKSEEEEIPAKVEEEEIHEEELHEKEVADDVFKPKVETIKPIISSSLYNFAKVDIPEKVIEEEEEDLKENDIASNVYNPTIESLTPQISTNIYHYSRPTIPEKQIEEIPAKPEEEEIHERIEEEEEIHEEEINEEIQNGITDKVLDENETYDKLMPSIHPALNNFQKVTIEPQETTELTIEDEEEKIEEEENDFEDKAQSALAKLSQLIPEEEEEKIEDEEKVEEDNFEDKAASALAKLSQFISSDEGESKIEEEEEIPEIDDDTAQDILKEVAQFDIPDPIIRSFAINSFKFKPKIPVKQQASPIKKQRVQMVMAPAEVKIVAISPFQATNLVDNLLNQTINEIRFVEKPEEEDEKQIEVTDEIGNEIAQRMINTDDIYELLKPKISSNLNDVIRKEEIEVKEEEEDLHEQQIASNTFTPNVENVKPDVSFKLYNFEYVDVPEIEEEDLHEDEITEKVVDESLKELAPNIFTSIDNFTKVDIPEKTVPEIEETVAEDIVNAFLNEAINDIEFEEKQEDVHSFVSKQSLASLLQIDNEEESIFSPQPSIETKREPTEPEINEIAEYILETDLPDPEISLRPIFNFKIKPVIPHNEEEKPEELREEQEIKEVEKECDVTDEEAKEITENALNQTGLDILKPEISTSLANIQHKPEIPVHEEEEQETEKRDVTDEEANDISEKVYEQNEIKELTPAISLSLNNFTMKPSIPVIEEKVEEEEKEEIIEEEENPEIIREEEIKEEAAEEEKRDVTEKEAEDIVRQISELSNINELTPEISTSINNFAMKPLIPVIEEKVEEEKKEEVIEEEEKEEVIEEEERKEEAVEEEKRDVTQEEAERIADNNYNVSIPEPEISSRISHFAPKPTIPVHEVEKRDVTDEESSQITNKVCELDLHISPSISSSLNNIQPKPEPVVDINIDESVSEKIVESLLQDSMQSIPLQQYISEDEAESIVGRNANLSIDVSPEISTSLDNIQSKPQIVPSIDSEVSHDLVENIFNESVEEIKLEEEPKKMTEPTNEQVLEIVQNIFNSNDGIKSLIPVLSASLQNYFHSSIPAKKAPAIAESILNQIADNLFNPNKAFASLVPPAPKKVIPKVDPQVAQTVVRDIVSQTLSEILFNEKEKIDLDETSKNVVDEKQFDKLPDPEIDASPLNRFLRKPAIPIKKKLSATQSEVEEITNDAFDDERTVESIKPEISLSVDNIKPKPQISVEIDPSVSAEIVNKIINEVIDSIKLTKEREISNEEIENITNNVFDPNIALEKLVPQTEESIENIQPKSAVEEKIEEEDIEELPEEEEIKEVEKECDVTDEEAKEITENALDQTELETLNPEISSSLENIQYKPEIPVHEKEEQEAEKRDVTDEEANDIAEKVYDQNEINELTPSISLSLNNFTMKPSIPAPRVIEEKVEEEEKEEIIEEEEKAEIIEEEEIKEEAAEEEKRDVTEKEAEDIVKLVSELSNINELTPEISTSLDTFAMKPLIPVKEEKAAEIIEEEEKPEITETEEKEEKVEEEEKEEIIEEEEKEEVIEEEERKEEAVEEEKRDVTQEEAERVADNNYNVSIPEPEIFSHISHFAPKPTIPVHEVEKRDVTDEESSQITNKVCELDLHISPSISSSLNNIQPKPEPVVDINIDESVSEKIVESLLQESTQSIPLQHYVSEDEVESIVGRNANLSADISPPISTSLDNIQSKPQIVPSIDSDVSRNIVENIVNESVEDIKLEEEKHEPAHEEIIEITKKALPKLDVVNPYVPEELAFFSPRNVVYSHPEEEENHDIHTPENVPEIDEEVAKDIVQNLMDEVLNSILHKEEIPEEEEQKQEEVEQEEEKSKEEEQEEEKIEENEQQEEAESKPEEEEESKLEEPTEEQIAKIAENLSPKEIPQPIVSSALSNMKFKPQIPEKAAETRDVTQQEIENIAGNVFDPFVSYEKLAPMVANSLENYEMKEEIVPEIEPEAAKEVVDEIIDETVKEIKFRNEVSNEEIETIANKVVNYQITEPRISSALSNMKPKPKIPVVEEQKHEISEEEVNQISENVLINEIPQPNLKTDLENIQPKPEVVSKESEEEEYEEEFGDVDDRNVDYELHPEEETIQEKQKVVEKQPNENEIEQIVENVYKPNLEKPEIKTDALDNFESKPEVKRKVSENEIQEITEKSLPNEIPQPIIRINSLNHIKPKEQIPIKQRAIDENEISQEIAENVAKIQITNPQISASKLDNFKISEEIPVKFTDEDINEITKDIPNESEAYEKLKPNLSASLHYMKVKPSTVIEKVSESDTVFDFLKEHTSEIIEPLSRVTPVISEIASRSEETSTNLTSNFEPSYSEFNNNELPSEEIFVRSEEIPSEEVTIKFEKSYERSEVIEDKSEINREDSIDKQDEELSDINNTTYSKGYEQEFSGLLDELLTEKDTRFGLTHSLLEGSLIYDDSRINTGSEITSEVSEDIADRKSLKIAINVTNEITEDETIKSVKPNISSALDNIKAVGETDDHNEEIMPIEQEESSIKQDSEIQSRKPSDDSLVDLDFGKRLARERARLSLMVSGDSSQLSAYGADYEEDVIEEEENMDNFVEEEENIENLEEEEEKLENFYAQFEA